MQYGTGVGAGWYLDRILLDASVGFKSERVQGRELGKATNLSLQSYVLDGMASFRFGSRWNWHFGPLLQSQVSTGIIRYTRDVSGTIGQVYWGGLGLGYDMTWLLDRNHFRVGLKWLTSLNLPDQRANYLVLNLGFLIGGRDPDQVIVKSDLPDYLKQSTFAWLQERDAYWDSEAYWRAHQSFEDRSSRKSGTGRVVRYSTPSKSNRRARTNIDQESASESDTIRGPASAKEMEVLERFPQRDTRAFDDIKELIKIQRR